MIDNVKAQFNLALYKDMLEFQKQLMEQFLSENLQGVQSSQNSVETSKAVENIVEGMKVSIYA